MSNTNEENGISKSGIDTSAIAEYLQWLYPIGEEESNVNIFLKLKSS